MTGFWVGIVGSCAHVGYESKPSKSFVNPKRSIYSETEDNSINVGGDAVAGKYFKKDLDKLGASDLIPV